jgi:acyl-CoA thioesterase
MPPTRILLDQNAPLGLRRFLSEYEVVPARSMGWATIANGDLIKAADDAGFSVLITCDRNIRYQQNLAVRRISLIELSIGNWTVVRNHLDDVLAAVQAAAPGSYRVVTFPRPLLRRRGSREHYERARACADAMLAEDRATQGLGILLAAVGPGSATMTMMVRDDMVNGHGMCHGGFIFTLADSAFAFACNSYNERAVAQHNSITYLRPGRLGEMLTAVAEERVRQGRSGLYDVRVTGSDGTVVAEFRGQSRTIGGTFFPEG